MAKPRPPGSLDSAGSHLDIMGLVTENRVLGEIAKKPQTGTYCLEVSSTKTKTKFVEQPTKKRLFFASNRNRQPPTARFCTAGKMPLTASHRQVPPTPGKP